jgi:hypothetical protein
VSVAPARGPQLGGRANLCYRGHWMVEETVSRAWGLGRLLAGAGLAVTLAFSFAGCSNSLEEMTSPGGEGASCSSTDACASGLSCRLEHCRRLCYHARECPILFRCVRVESAGACIPADSLRCADGCPFRFTCGPDQLCHPSCGNDLDCVDPQMCKAGVCSRE